MAEEKEGKIDTQVTTKKAVKSLGDNILDLIRSGVAKAAANEKAEGKDDSRVELVSAQEFDKLLTRELPKSWSEFGEPTEEELRKVNSLAAGNGPHRKRGAVRRDNSSNSNLSERRASLRRDGSRSNLEAGPPAPDAQVVTTPPGPKKPPSEAMAKFKLAGK